MTMKPSVYTIILNWRGWQDTLECIRSLKESDYANLTIVVVDNDSQDESVARIQELYPDVKLIKSAQNCGFARGNNIGILFALSQNADYIFVLNNDTTLANNCISELVQFSEKNLDAALIGPQIFDMGTKVYRQWSVQKRLDFWSIVWILSPFRRIIYNTPLFRKFFYISDEPGQVYGIPGSSMFFRSSTLEKINLFDENTFLYWEEFIIAEKLYALNLLTYVVPQAHIWHKENASISKIGARKFIENVKSERYFFRKYLKLSYLEQAILNSIRLVAYLGRCLSEVDYRVNLSKFFQVFLNA
jgi:GT2 family glycosyltransferase